jgi:OOP family OmpA-OmpF porin
VIEGHTDSVGDHASNMKLSQRRADSVRSYLIKTFGVAPERLDAKGYGPDRPRATNKTPEGRSQNRRIEANFVCP